MAMLTEYEQITILKLKAQQKGIYTPVMTESELKTIIIGKMKSHGCSQEEIDAAISKYV